MKGFKETNTGAREENLTPRGAMDVKGGSLEADLKYETPLSPPVSAWLNTSAQIPSPQSIY